jgi:uncharacterized protein
MRIKGKIIALTSILLLWTGVGRCAEASFDCYAKHLSHTEQEVCSDAALSELDFELGFIYAHIKASTSQPVDEQRAWVAQRDKCTDLECLRAAYQSRIAALSSTEISLFGESTYQSRGGAKVATPIAYFQETYPGQVGEMAFSADDKRLAVVTSLGDALHIWEWREHPRLVMKLDWPSLYRGGMANTIAYSGDGKLLAFAHDSLKSDGLIETVRIYDARDGRLVHRIFEPASANSTQAVLFTFDGKFLLQLHAGRDNGLPELVRYRVDTWASASASLKYPFTA